MRKADEYFKAFVNVTLILHWTRRLSVSMFFYVAEWIEIGKETRHLKPLDLVSFLLFAVCHRHLCDSEDNLLQL